MASFKIQDFKAMVAPLGAMKQPWATRAHNAFTQAQDIFNRIVQRINEIEARLAAVEGFAGSTTQFILVKHFFITADTTLPFPSEPVGSVFLYVIEIDPNGPWTVSWPVGFEGLFNPTSSSNSVSTWMVWKRSSDRVIAAMTGLQDVKKT